LTDVFESNMCGRVNCCWNFLWLLLKARRKSCDNIIISNHSSIAEKLRDDQTVKRVMR